MEARADALEAENEALRALLGARDREILALRQELVRVRASPGLRADAGGVPSPPPAAPPSERPGGGGIPSAGGSYLPTGARTPPGAAAAARRGSLSPPLPSPGAPSVPHPSVAPAPQRRA